MIFFFFFFFFFLSPFNLYSSRALSNMKKANTSGKDETVENQKASPFFFFCAFC